MSHGDGGRIDNLDEENDAWGDDAIEGDIADLESQLSVSERLRVTLAAVGMSPLSAALLIVSIGILFANRALGPGWLTDRISGS